MSIQQRVNICPECGATQGRPHERCWLCGEEIPTLSPAAASDQPKTIASKPKNFASKNAPRRALSFSLATLLLILTLASVCFGACTLYPGAAIPLSVLILPVIVRTLLVVRQRKVQGKEVTSKQKTALFAESLAVSWVIASAVSIAAAGAAICAFFVSCLSAVGGSAQGNRIELAVFGSAVVAGLAVLIPLLFWVRNRYLRDVGRE